jgi:uncharacterized repeat protein (TIGR03803 family)
MFKRLHIAFLVGSLSCAFTAGAQTIQVVHSFSGPDGDVLTSALLQASDGSFYGTAQQGSDTYYGTAFKITTNGEFTLLHSFDVPIAADPVGALIQDTNGTFLGTAFQGGVFTNGYQDTSYPNGEGTIYRLTTNGDVTMVASFNGTNGADPLGLIRAGDGNYYGLANRGGAINKGTAFVIRREGGLTRLLSFTGPNGTYPEGSLIEGIDGNLYGTTSQGGAITNGYGTTGYGTVFRMTTNGNLTTLVSFGSTNGARPISGLVQTSDGNFFGTTWYGGPYTNAQSFGWGTVFKMTPAGVLTTLVYFNNTNGAGPMAGLCLARDGSFYGTTARGGDYDKGTVFKITSDGTFVSLASFNGTNGSYPEGGLVQGTDGNIYGTTFGGGQFGSGTIYRLVVDPIRLDVRRNTGAVVLEWSDPTFSLQSATNVSGPWEKVANAASPYTNDFTGSPQEFFRLER